MFSNIHLNITFKMSNIHLIGPKTTSHTWCPSRCCTVFCEAVHRASGAQCSYSSVEPGYWKALSNNAGGKASVLYLGKASGNLAANIWKTFRKNLSDLSLKATTARQPHSFEMLTTFFFWMSTHFSKNLSVEVHFYKMFIMNPYGKATKTTDS